LKNLTFKLEISLQRCVKNAWIGHPHFNSRSKPILYLVLFLITLSGCTERQIRVHFENAQRQQAHGHIDSAMAEYRTILTLDPKAADAHNALGALYARRGSFQQALTHHRQAHAITPDQPDIHFNLGIAYVGLGQTDSAMIAYQAVIKKEPKHSDAHNGLGTVYAMLGNINNARQHYQKAVEHNPRNADAYNNLGLLDASQGQLIEAAINYQKAIGHQPNFPDALNNLGSALAELGQYDQAQPHFENALRLNPNHQLARDNLTQIQEQKKRIDAGEMRARHILVRTEQEAKDVLTKLKDGAPFAALVKIHSIDPRYDGDVGAFLPGTLMPEFEKAVKQTQPSRIDGPFKTPAGYHIIHRLY
jgi:tetratricopeptide (TPR) repeat protein